MATKKSTESEAEAALQSLAIVTYRDKHYTHRSLFLPSMRELQVRQGRVTVSADDAEALEYLDGNSELQLLQQAG